MLSSVESVMCALKCSTYLSLNKRGGKGGVERIQHLLIFHMVQIFGLLANFWNSMRIVVL